MSRICALQNWEDSANIRLMLTIQTVMSVGSTVLLLSAKTKQENQCNEASRLSKNVLKRAQRYLTWNMEKSPCKLNLPHCRQKTTTSLWNRTKKGIGKTRKMWPQANNAQYNTQGWDMRGGSEVRRQWEGRVWAAPLYQLISEPGEMVWQYIYFPTLLKKGLLLTVIQIRGTAETRRCDADAVRLQVITWNPPLTLLSLPSLIQHMVYRGVPK